MRVCVCVCLWEIVLFSIIFIYEKNPVHNHHFQSLKHNLYV